jgi:hypothetical protein
VQERNRFPSTKDSRKKAGVDENQPQGLGGLAKNEEPDLETVKFNSSHLPDLASAAIPATGNTELTSLGQVDVDTIPSTDLAEMAVPTDENTESTSLVDQVDVDSTPSAELHDSTMPSEENLELALLDTDVEEANLNDLQDSKGSNRANHGKRQRHE